MTPSPIRAPTVREGDEDSKRGRSPGNAQANRN